MKNLCFAKYQRFVCIGAGCARAKKRKMRAICACFALFFAITFAICLCDCTRVAYAQDKTDEELQKELSDAINGAIESLDLSELQSFLDSLSSESKQALSVNDVKDMLKALVNGESNDFFESFFNLLSKTAGRYFLSFLPGCITIIAICLLKNVLCGMTGDFLNNSTSEVVHVVCYCSIVIVLVGGVFDVVSAVSDTIGLLSDFAGVIFPVLLALLSALGGAGSVGGYSPLMAVFCGSIIKMTSSVILPSFVACIVFCIVGNLSKSVKLDKLTKFVRSASGWLIGIVFGLFATFLTMQGISGGVIDKFGFNVAKFAVSSYVPILGGYLSDGFDLLTASVVIVKNALGYTGAIVLCSIVVFPLVKVVVFSLALKLCGAIAEPIGDGRVATLLTATAKNANLLVSALAGIGFIFFLMFMMLMSTCNMGV